MKLRLIKLRFRRRWHQRQRWLGDFGDQAEQQIERHLFKRFNRLTPIRRFLTGWLGLVVLLIAALIFQNIWLSRYYQTLKPVPGGIYTEGVQGRFTTANPLYVTTDADTTVSRLIFSGLFTYDEHGKLVGDLASDYQVNAQGNIYTVRLKPNLTWQDGWPLTSADVAFTFNLIKNPDAQSPLQNGWRGIAVTTPDAHTVVFKLPGELAPFAHNLTTGIVPKHLLAKVPPSDLRSADFNTVHPVGAGPFAWQAVQVTGNGDPGKTGAQIALTPFEQYQGGAPKLQKFVVQVFATKDQLARAFADNRLTAAEGLNEVPESVKKDRSLVRHGLPLRAATMVFFKTTSSGPLSDKQVRQALVRAADAPRIIRSLGYSTHAVREPLLPGQVGYDPSLVQAGFDLSAARQMLEANGWRADKNGLRSKAGQRLTFTLSATNTPEYRLVARKLQQNWRAAGIDVRLKLQSAGDFQNTLAYHSYDAVLYGISIGSDPDVYAYWNSSQADVRSANRLNLSEWKNPSADAALEAGRNRLDPQLRAVKYKPFLQAWQQDAPALGLYQPRLLYLTRGPVDGLYDGSINTSADRLNNVHNWQIRQGKVTN